MSRRAVLAAHPAAGWLEQGTVDDPASLLDLDLEALAGGAAPGLGAPVTGSVVLVCTNGRRDLCCAEVGRARVEELAPHLGDALWESSHLGGHRFAPTVLLLPSGLVLGRATARDVLEALDGRLPLKAYRGCSALPPPAQAAEHHVLLEVGAADRHLLRVGAPEGAGPWRTAVRHDDGRRWTVEVDRVTGPMRPESCGREPEPYEALVVTSATLAQG